MEEVGEDATQGFLAGDRKDDLPTYRMTDVAKHKTKEDGYWVTFRGGVYDVSEFVAMHPGGKKIFLAVGGPVDPFWQIFRQHLGSGVQELLEENYRIGNLHPDDQMSEEELDANDPFANEPTDRSPLLKVVTKKPFTAECPNEIILDEFVTPNELHYVRCHSAVPLVDMDEWRLRVKGRDGKELELTLDDLRNKFQRHEVMMTLQCCGNRAAGERWVNGKSHIVGTFFDGGISNAKWSGVRLRDLLAAVDIDADGSGYKYVNCVALDGEKSDPYNASVTMQKAVDPFGDVIVAYEMNGKPIPRDHGFPCRMIIPGWAGLNNVKWLTQLEATKEAPEEFRVKLEQGRSSVIRDLPVQSLITTPRVGAELDPDDDELEVQGYAYSGLGRKVLKVDVSKDGGETWTTADLTQTDQPEGQAWSWTHWAVTLPLEEEERGKLHLVVKAVDSSFQSQPRVYQEKWMDVGVCNNIWHRVGVERPVPEE